MGYFLGFILGFAFCASSTKSYAEPVPAVMNTQNTQSNVNTQTIFPNEITNDTTLYAQWVKHGWTF